MSWKEQLQPASFRGVSFHIDSVDTNFGRRNQVHEYPRRETPYSEDLGKKAREYSFRAYVLGDNYLIDLDRLMKAIEDKTSPGTLVHPSLGAKLVIPTRCSVSFSNREGGIEYFNLSFVEAGENRFPKDSKNSKAKVFERIGSFRDLLKDNLERVYQGSSQVEAVTGRSFSAANDFLDLMETSLQYSGPVQEVFSSFKTGVAKLRSRLVSLVYSPGEMADEFIGLFETFNSAQVDPQVKLDSSLRLLDLDALEDTPETTTVTEETALSNDRILRYFLRGLSLGQSAQAVVELSFPSKKEALETRDLLRDLMEEEELGLSDFGFSELANSLSSLRAELVQDIHERAVFLPNISTIELSEPLPALVLAYRLHDDSDEEQSLVERNRIANPLFAAGSIEFLS